MNQAIARLKATATDESMDMLMKQAKAQAKKMTAYMKANEKQDDGYVALQREMQKILKKIEKLDPTGENTPFDYEVWTHSAKPFRKSSSL